MSGGFGLMFDGRGPEHLRFEWTETTRRLMAEIAPVILARLKQEAPVGEERPGGRQSGRLKNSIGYKTETTPGTASLFFVSTAPYARYVIQGTRGGQMLVPQSAFALRYYNNGDFVFASSIIRGDTPKNEFNKRVATELEPFIRNALRNAIVVIGT